MPTEQKEYATKSFFETELEKDSLKEPKLKWNKLLWLKPLNPLSHKEYRGIDPRDQYLTTKKDAWDHQIWNTASPRRSVCQDFWVDYVQCGRALEGSFPNWNIAVGKEGQYCWRPYINYVHCAETYMHSNPQWMVKGSKMGHH